MSIYKSLCCELMSSGDMKTLTQFRVKAAYFPPDDKPLFDYVIRHFDKHAAMPNEDAIRVAIDQNFEMETTGQPLSFWCERVIHQQRVNVASKATKDAISDLEENDVDSWLRKVHAAAMTIESTLTETTDVVIDSVEREKLVIERYEERTLTQGVVGIKLPWDFLNTETGGLQGGDVNVITANTGVGKTWLLLLIAIKAWLDGATVLFVSKEMHGDVIEDRFHSANGYIPYKLFRHGKLEEDLVAKMKEIIKQVCAQDSRRFIVVDDVSNSAGGMMEIEAKILEYKPTLLCIDGIYLVADDAGGEDLDWKSVGRVVTRLKRVLKKYGIPGVVTTQNRDLTGQQQKKKSGGESHNSTSVVAYTKEISRIASLMMNLYQSSDDKANKLMRLFLPKVREGENLSVTLNWNFDTMNFTMLEGATPTADAPPPADAPVTDEWPDDSAAFNV